MLKIKFQVVLKLFSLLFLLFLNLILKLSLSFSSYSFYDSFIRFIISKFSVKHSDRNVHISFDHMFCKEKFTILLFSLLTIIILFFLLIAGSILLIYSLSSSLFPTNIVVSNCSKTDDVWYILTNADTSRTVRNYSYRFGSIGCIFKSQKSNDFRLESTNTQKIEHFISLFTIMCVALTWLTIIGADYVKNKHHYHLKIRHTRKRKNGSCYRYFSLFNLGLTIFNLCYYNSVNFTLKFSFVLYDI